MFAYDGDGGINVRAAVLNGPGDLQVLDKPLPEPGAVDVLVRVEYCGICGSDLHAYKSGMFPFGLTIGHEYAGVIEAVGSAVKGWAPGQRITGTASLACRACPSCRGGRDNICEAMNVIGVTREGAMAEYLLTPAASLLAVPASMPLEFAALVEPLSVALHGVDLAAAAPGDTAVIIGGGTLGLCTLAELKRLGLKAVYMVELNEARAAVAAAMGADAVLNPERENVDNRLSALTGGAGADLVFECVGLPDTIRDAANMARQGGSVVVLGICEVPVELFFLGLVTREIQLRTSYGSTAREFKRALDLLASKEIDLRTIVTRIVSLEQVMEQGFTPLLEQGSTEIKILVKC
ncbi:MAG: alcohol dehydrogenase catalytic domain-containing protein [Bacillota bacterium]